MRSLLAISLILEAEKDLLSKEREESASAARPGETRV
jgi:hypothetical protein